MNKFGRILVIKTEPDKEFLNITPERAEELKNLIIDKVRKTLVKNIIEKGYIWISFDTFLMDCYNNCTDIEEKIYSIHLVSQLFDQVFSKGTMDNVEIIEYQNSILEQVMSNVKIVLKKDEVFVAMAATSSAYKTLRLAVNNEI